MHVYPNPDSWDEFYPGEIFIAMNSGDSEEEALRIFKKANIGATIVLGEPGATTSYKKVAAIESLGDFEASLVLLSRLLKNGG